MNTADRRIAHAAVAVLLLAPTAAIRGFRRVAGSPRGFERLGAGWPA